MTAQLLDKCLVDACTSFLKRRPDVGQPYRDSDV